MNEGMARVNCSVYRQGLKIGQISIDEISSALEETDMLPPKPSDPPQLFPGDFQIDRTVITAFKVIEHGG